LYPSVAVYRILLAIHDAALLEVPGAYVKAVTERVLPYCMRAQAPSWRPVASWKPTEKFKLDLDISVAVRWGETPTADELRANGVPEDLVAKYAGKDE
jgi:hypothetical protein